MKPYYSFALLLVGAACQDPTPPPAGDCAPIAYPTIRLQVLDAATEQSLQSIAIVTVRIDSDHPVQQTGPIADGALGNPLGLTMGQTGPIFIRAEAPGYAADSVNVVVPTDTTICGTTVKDVVIRLNRS